MLRGKLSRVPKPAKKSEHRISNKECRFRKCCGSFVQKSAGLPQGWQPTDCTHRERGRYLYRSLQGLHVQSCVTRRAFLSVPSDIASAYVENPGEIPQPALRRSSVQAMYRCGSTALQCVFQHVSATTTRLHICTKPQNLSVAPQDQMALHSVLDGPSYPREFLPSIFLVRYSTFPSFNTSE